MRSLSEMDTSDGKTDMVGAIVRCFILIYKGVPIAINLVSGDL